MILIMLHDVSGSVHKCGEDRHDAAVDPLVAELAHASLQPQLLQMSCAAIALSQAYGQRDYAHLDPWLRPTSKFIIHIYFLTLEHFHHCFCLNSPCPIDISSPKYIPGLRSLLSFSMEALHGASNMPKIWTVRGRHHVPITTIISHGVRTPLLLMKAFVAAHLDSPSWPSGDWPSRVVLLKDALQVTIISDHPQSMWIQISKCSSACWCVAHSPFWFERGLNSLFTLSYRTGC